MTQATLGYGSKLKLGDVTGLIFADVGEITSSISSENSVDLREVTNHQSVGKRREYIGAFIDGGEITITCNYIPTDPTHRRSTGIRGLLGQKRKMRIEEPGNTKGDEFDVIFTKDVVERPVQEEMTLEFAFKVTGPVTEYTVV